MVGDFTKRTIWLTCLFLVLSTTFALGQGIVTGSIAGTVLDPQKAVVVGAKVAAKNVATSVEFKSTTNDQGYFSIRSVPVGTYRVAVDAPNFKKLEVDGVLVSTGLTTDMGPLTLALGAAAETVTVEAAAPLIETTTAQGGATFTNKEASNLPVNGGFDVLVLFAPGIVSAGEANFTNNNGAQFASNGQRDRSNNFQIDGQYNNDNSVAGPAYFFGNQDAVQEVQVVTNNFGVEYGRNSGAQVNYVTKSGTNNFHGSLFEYYTGNYADSLTNEEKSPLLTGSPAVSRYTENRWGGTIGGPVIPNKIFFFASYMQDTPKGTGTFTSGSLTTPTPTGLAQLATCFPGNVGVSILSNIGPYSRAVGSPTPTPTGTQNISNGVTTCNNVEVGSVSRDLPGIFNDYEVAGRVDFALSPKDNFFARYIFQQQLNTGAFGTAGTTGSNSVSQSIAAGGEVDVSGRNQQIALDWTRNWTSHLVNQVRFGYVRLGAFFQGGLFSNCTVAAFPSGACPTLIVMSSPGLSFGMGNNLPQDRVVNNSQWQDNASWQHGRHTIKFGGEYQRQRSPDIFLPQFNGQYSVPNLTALMSNAATRLILTNGNPRIPFKEQDAALYAGDDWRIRDNLTLNIGLRWEFTQSAFNQLAEQTIQRETNPATAFWDMTLPLNLRTVNKIPNVWHNFGPNLGFAWTPHLLKGILGENKTVIRGGFRIAYDPAFYNIFLNIASSAPLANAGTIPTAPQACPGVFCSMPASGLGVDVRNAHLPDIPTGGNPGFRNETRVSPNFHNPYAETWSLGVQREVTTKIAAEVRYVGSHTVGEFQSQNGNPSLSGLIANGFGSLIPAGVTPCAIAGQPGFASGRPDCNFTNLRIRANTAFANYNSLQSQVKFVSWHGFSAVAAYTWSKNIDNSSEIFSTFSANTVSFAQNPYCTGSCEKGLSALDYPHNLSLYWQYDLPFGKGQQGMMKYLLNGWTVAGTYRYLSGQEWTPADFAGGNSSCQNSFDGAFISGVTSCRPFMGNSGAPVDTVGQCLNAAAPDCGIVDYYTGLPTTMAAVRWIANDNVSAQFFGTPYGNVGRNPPGVRGDSVSTVNLNLLKSTRVTEKVELKLEANVLNVANRMFRGVPDPFIGDVNFANAALLGFGGSFGNTFFNSSGGGTANVVGTGLSHRRIILGAHIIF